MPTLIQECDQVTNHILFQALTEAQQAEVLALATEAERRARVEALLADLA